MLGATLYIIACSARNRARQRLRRLREPRYLVGAVAGIAYLVFTLLIRQRAFVVPDTGRAVATAAGASLFAVSGPTVAGLALACASLASWLMPFSSGVLDFSKAEIAFLFPSPMNRAQLVMYRLLRSQIAVFTAALIVALAYPAGTLFGRLRGLIGIWILLMAVRVFFAGIDLARARMRSAVPGFPRFVWPAVMLPAGAVLSVLVPFLMQPPAPDLDATSTVANTVRVITTIAAEGVARVLLAPFTWLVRPLFAATLAGFGQSLVAAVAVYGVAVAWLMWADALSVESADASAERQVSQPARRARAYVARSVGWQLRGAGRPETAFVWKGVLQTFRTVDRRVIGRIVLILIWMVGASLFITRTRGLVLLLGVFSTWGALFAVFMAPQAVRMDLRQDLAHLELLKTWPISGAAVLRGEIIWPAAVVTGIGWTFGIVAMVLSMISTSGIPAPNRLAAWLSFLVLCPGIVLAQYTVHNAVAVLFPGWVPLGPSRARGVDAVGQRLILLVGNWLGLLVALVPGVVVTAGLSLLLRPRLGPLVLPVGALVTTLTVVGEMLLVTRAMGRVYDRLDVSSVERPE
jgi:ABC-2 type transport system permease protein